MSILYGQDKRLLLWCGDLNQHFVLEQIEGSECYSLPYTYYVKFSSQLPYDQVCAYLGKKVGCQIGHSERERFVHGIFTSIQQITDRGQGYYLGRIEPQYKLLEMGQRCRVYQHKTIPEIVQSLLNDVGISDVKLRLFNQYEKVEYCIQYRESDYSFIQRLLAKVGIYYFFVHSENKHEMILADHFNAHSQSSPKVLPFHPKKGTQKFEGITHWTSIDYLSIKQSVVKGFNIEQASSIKSNVYSSTAPHIANGINYEDYVADNQVNQLDARAKCLIEQAESHHCEYEASAYTYWLTTGLVFRLSGHPDCDGDYVVKALSLLARNNIDSVETTIECQINVLPSKTLFRPQISHSHPIISGVLTAKVVGPSSEEVYTDEQGRVKIQFHWDNENHYDDKSSCWVRVSQPWTGNHFGMQFIPRVGNEVVVSFIDGHSDYPIITGMLFNGQNKPPLSLPQEKSRSMLSTRSTPRGNIGDGHQIIFEDKKNAECITVSSQKDCQINVPHDLTESVGHDMTQHVSNNRQTTIDKGNDSLTLNQGNLSTQVSMGKYQIMVSQGDMETKINMGNLKQNVSLGSYQLYSAQTCKIESMQSIELVVGTSKITLSQTGITISGMSVSIEGQISTEVKGTMVQVEGQVSTGIKGAIVQVNGEGMLQLNGGITMIG